MPHNYIFGQELSHQLVGNHMEGRCDGRTNSHNTVGMKRKESWMDLEAGNFEMQRELGGPTCEKRLKSSPEIQEEALVAPTGLDSTALTSEEENSPHVCHSMVTHMAMSYRNDNLQAQQKPEDLMNSMTDRQKSFDVDMECVTPMENESVSQEAMHYTQDTWYGWSCHNPAQSNGNWWENIVGCFHGS